MVAIALKTIGSAAKFFLTRHWERSWVGPYVITTTEARPGAYETTVTWGEAGPQVEQFGSGLSFDLDGAEDVHREVCERVEREVGLERQPAPRPPAA